MAISDLPWDAPQRRAWNLLNLALTQWRWLAETKGDVADLVKVEDAFAQYKDINLAWQMEAT